MQKLCSALLLVLALISVGPQASAAPAAKEEEAVSLQSKTMRHLHCPRGQSVGELFNGTTWDFSQSHTEGRYIGPARGDYEIPSTLPIILTINYAGAEKPELLKQVSNNIDWLNLGKFQIDDTAFPCITHLTNLKRIDLYNTDTTDLGISSLAKFINLETLNASSTFIKGTTIFQLPLKKLTFLAVDCNTLNAATVANITNYPHLKHLEIQKTNIGDHELQFIGRLKELTQLNLAGNAGVGDTGLQYLKDLKKLKLLDLRDTKVTFKGLLSLNLPLSALSLPCSIYSAAELAALKKHFQNCKLFTRPQPTQLQKDLFAPLH